MNGTCKQKKAVSKEKRRREAAARGSMETSFLLGNHVYSRERIASLCRVVSENVRALIEKYLLLEVKTKSEGKKYFENLRNEIMEF